MYLPSNVGNFDFLLRQVDHLNETLGESITIKNVENLFGGNVSDLIIGDDKVNVLSGFGGNDYIIGNGGDDLLGGGHGNDTLEGGLGHDYIAGDAGGLNGNDYLTGDVGRDTLEGGSGDDTLRGGADIDVLDGNSGNDSLYGGSGADIFVLSDGNAYVRDFEAGSDRIQNTRPYQLVIYGSGTEIETSGGSIYLVNTTLSQTQSLIDNGLLWA